VRFLLSLQRLHKRTDIHGLMHQGHTTTTHIRVMTLEEEKRHQPLDNPRS
jgi:hypothetical protein